jgi:hypothetical protein
MKNPIYTPTLMDHVLKTGAQIFKIDQTSIRLQPNRQSFDTYTPNRDYMSFYNSEPIFLNLIIYTKLMLVDSL